MLKTAKFYGSINNDDWSDDTEMNWTLKWFSLSVVSAAILNECRKMYSPYMSKYRLNWSDSLNKNENVVTGKNFLTAKNKIDIAEKSQIAIYCHVRHFDRLIVKF